MFIKRNKPNRQLVPVGTHTGVCILICDLGRQANGKYEPQEKIYYQWELPDMPMTWTDRKGVEHTAPKRIGKFYHKTFHENGYLLRDLKTWTDKSFSEEELDSLDIADFLGQSARLEVIHNAKGRDEIAAISASLPGVAPKPSVEPMIYDLEDPDEAVFAKLPDWLQKLIHNRLITEPAQKIESPANKTDAADGSEFDDPIPFS